METKNIAPDAKKILVVDDDPVIQKAMSLMLTTKGYRVIKSKSEADTISIPDPGIKELI